MKRACVKQFLSIICIIFFQCILLACAADQDETIHTGENKETVGTVEDLFSEEYNSEEGDKEDEETGNTTVSFFSIGVNTSLVKDLKAYVVYDGGEMELSVHFLAGGSAADRVGLLLYVNGIPHAYRVADLDETLLRETMADSEEYLYIHTFQPKDGADINCTLCFTPLVGEEGDSLEIYLAGFNYPEEGSQFQMIGVVRPMVYQSTPTMTEPEGVSDDLISSVEFTETEITTEIREEYEDYFYGSDKSENDDWNFFPQSRLWIDDVSMDTAQIYAIEEKDILHVCLEVLGPSLVHYQVTVYVDYDPINIGEENWIEVETETGKIVRLELDLDISMLEGTNAFYIVLVPENYWEMRDLDIIPEAQTTNTIWLYRGVT